MRKHIIIIALFYLSLGIALGVLFIAGHIQFFSFYSNSLSAQSVTRDSYSLMQLVGNFYQIYRAFFLPFGINPLFSLLTVVSSLAFGYGLLKSKKWAVILGFGIVILNLYSFVSALFNESVSTLSIFQLTFTAYMWWTLCRKDSIAV